MNEFLSILLVVFCTCLVTATCAGTSYLLFIVRLAILDKRFEILKMQERINNPDEYHISGDRRMYR